MTNTKQEAVAKAIADVDASPGWREANPDEWKEYMREAAAALSAIEPEWREMDSAPKDGTKFIARREDEVRTTWATDHYVKWPHQEGGPTYQKRWTYEALDALIQWSPTKWMPLPDASNTEGDNDA